MNFIKKSLKSFCEEYLRIQGTPMSDEKFKKLCYTKLNLYGSKSDCVFASNSDELIKNFADDNILLILYYDPFSIFLGESKKKIIEQIVLENASTLSESQQQILTEYLTMALSNNQNTYIQDQLLFFLNDETYNFISGEVCVDITFFTFAFLFPVFAIEWDILGLRDVILDENNFLDITILQLFLLLWYYLDGPHPGIFWGMLANRGMD